MVVNLPSGNSIASSICGSVQLSSELIIDNVLYLPQFEVNLKSVSKLCKEQECVLNFETDKCVIQARKDLRKIGSARAIDGLYHLEAAKEVGFVSSIFTCNNRFDELAPTIL